MAQSNWAYLNNGATVAQIDNGVTAGIVKPNGGGTNLYGFNSLQNIDGVVGLHAAQDDFAPLARGGSVRAAIKRGPGGGPIGFTPFMFIGLQDSDVAASGYILGLSNGDPHHISLRKGSLDGGVPDSGADPDGTDNILMRSTAAYTNDTWLHLRLDMITQGSGDVILQVFQNDLAANLVTDPTWEIVPGMEGDQAPTIDGFVDDSLGINTNSAPFTSGYIGYGFQSNEVSRRGFIDHVEIARQL